MAPGARRRPEAGSSGGGPDLERRVGVRVAAAVRFQPARLRRARGVRLQPAHLCSRGKLGCAWKCTAVSGHSPEDDAHVSCEPAWVARERPAHKRGATRLVTRIGEGSQAGLI